MKAIHEQFIISSQYQNQRIDRVLAQLLPEYSRSQITQWIQSGAVSKNQKPCKPKDKVMDQDQVEINAQQAFQESSWTAYNPENIPLNIVFEDEELLVLNKPAGLVVHPGAGNREHTLLNALLHHAPHLKHLPRAGIIHRLDKDTTGLLLVAKSLTAQVSLTRQMQARDIQRHYLALVQGHLISGGIIDTPFGRHSKNRLKMAVTKQGRQAITQYTISKQYQDYTLLQIRLMTGRTHQIRVHLAHIKHPVVGDPLYGGRIHFPTQAKEALRSAFQQFQRQALHACRLSFSHPKTQEILTFEATLPDDLQHLLQLLNEWTIDKRNSH